MTRNPVLAARVLVSALVLVCLTSVATAMTIEVGTHRITTGKDRQTIILLAEEEAGTDLVQKITGMHLNAQVGALGASPQSRPLPVFETPAVDYALNGAIWNAFPFTATDVDPVGDPARLLQSQVVFSESGNGVAADGVIATLFINTDGVPPGQYPLILTEATLIGESTTFIGDGEITIVPDIRNGAIIVEQAVVPEPSAAVLAGIALALLLLGRFAGRVRKLFVERNSFRSPMTVGCAAAGTE